MEQRDVSEVVHVLMVNDARFFCFYPYERHFFGGSMAGTGPSGKNRNGGHHDEGRKGRSDAQEVLSIGLPGWIGSIPI